MVALYFQHSIWFFTAAQLIGLCSAILARFTENRWGQASFQVLFFAALAAVALITVGSISQGTNAWTISSLTLALMVVSVVWDPGTSDFSSENGVF